MTVGTYNKQGGISRYIAEMAERFVKEHEVHIFASGWTHVGNDDLIFHKIPRISKPHSISLISYALSATLKMETRDFDIVQSSASERFSADIFNPMSVLRAWLDVLKKEKHRTIFGMKILTPGYLVGLALEKHNYTKGNYKKLIACTNSTKRELVKYHNVPEEDIEVIPLGVNLDEFRPLQDINLVDLKQEYKIQDNDIVLNIVATEFHRKGLAELIRSLSIVKHENKLNLKLLVVGGGQNTIGFDYIGLADKLGVRDNIIFTGHVEDLNKHYNLADIFVFPTKYEGFGIPVIEAMAAGLPVVTTNTAAGEDAVENGKNGLLIEDPTNIREIAEKISILIEDKNLRNQMGKNARSTAEKFTWDDTAKRTLEVYEGAI